MSTQPSAQPLTQPITHAITRHSATHSRGHYTLSHSLTRSLHTQPLTDSLAHSVCGGVNGGAVQWIGRADPASVHPLDLIFFIRDNDNVSCGPCLASSCVPRELILTHYWLSSCRGLPPYDNDVSRSMSDLATPSVASASVLCFYYCPCAVNCPVFPAGVRLLHRLR